MTKSSPNTAKPSAEPPMLIDQPDPFATPQILRSFRDEMAALPPGRQRNEMLASAQSRLRDRLNLDKKLAAKRQ